VQYLRVYLEILTKLFYANCLTILPPAELGIAVPMASEAGGKIGGKRRERVKFIFPNRL
jgi:hypothetical protein